jgi:GNAT superfamily N-acetyltransferase
MSRPTVSVRRLGASQRASFIELWIAHRVETGTTVEAARRLSVDGTLTAALDRCDVVAFIAYVDTVPAGYVVLMDTTTSPLVDAPCVSISMLHVVPELRRQGVGRALLATAARHADRMDADHLASLVPAHDREANRFFARLGFAPETVRRVTSVAALQRRLGGERVARMHVVQVLQRRLDVRARAKASEAGPADSNGLGPVFEPPGSLDPSPAVG